MSGIYITLGHGATFGIEGTNHPGCCDDLFIADSADKVYPGPASKENLDRIITHMQQLRLHMPENEEAVLNNGKYKYG